MTTKAQAAANAQNARKSTGPKSEAGKARSRLNALVHGLRSQEILIAGEDPAEFEAERKAWYEEFRPKSRARAALVERAVLAAWRCRRCVRIDAQRLEDLGRNAIKTRKADAVKRVADAENLLMRNPAVALARLEAEREGVVRLIERWSGLVLAAATAETWAEAEEVAPSFVPLMGHSMHTMVQTICPAAVASWRINERAYPRETPNPFGPLDDEEAARALETVRDFIATKLDALKTMLAEFDNPEEIDAQTALAASVDASDEGKLLHRYEMAHDRSLRASITSLIQLDRSGIDLAEADDEAAKSEVEPTPEIKAPSEAIAPKPMEINHLQPAPVVSFGARPTSNPVRPTRADFDAFFAVGDELAGRPEAFRDGLIDLLGQ